MSRTGLNRDWASLYGNQELIRYKIMPIIVDANHESVKLWISALDSIQIEETDGGYEFTTYLMLPPPEGWVLSRIEN